MERKGEKKMHMGREEEKKKKKKKSIRKMKATDD